MMPHQECTPLDTHLFPFDCIPTDLTSVIERCPAVVWCRFDLVMDLLLRYKVGAVKDGDVMTAGIKGMPAPIEIKVPVVSSD